jgi:hypothetical protein
MLDMNQMGVLVHEVPKDPSIRKITNIDYLLEGFGIRGLGVVG